MQFFFRGWVLSEEINAANYIFQENKHFFKKIYICIIHLRADSQRPLLPQIGQIYRIQVATGLEPGRMIVNYFVLS